MSEQVVERILHNLDLSGNKISNSAIEDSTVNGIRIRVNEEGSVDLQDEEGNLIQLSRNVLESARIAPVLIGDDTTKKFELSHDLSSKNVMIQARRVDGKPINPYTEVRSESSVYVEFLNPPPDKGVVILLLA